MLFAGCAIECAVGPSLYREDLGVSRQGAKNGLWLRYTWYFGAFSREDAVRAVEQARECHIRDAFFHVRYVRADGSLKFRFPENARRLNRVFTEVAPEMRRTAWIYVSSKEADITNAKVRKQMCSEAQWLINECGFQGVQWDVEPSNDGDPSLLHLLDETRAALPSGSFISVAAPNWYPWPLSKIGWSETYFGEVAKRCNQIAVMCYDTGFRSPSAYLWLVSQNVQRVSLAVCGTNPRCEVLFGLPTYEEGGFSHYPRSENLRMGLLGVRDGVSSLGSERNGFAGVAVFADYTTEEEEWKTFRQLWVCD